MEDTVPPSPSPPLQNWPEIMTVKQIAAYLQVKICTIYKWVRKNFIPHIKKGGMLRFRKTVIDRWLYEKKNKKNKEQ